MCKEQFENIEKTTINNEVDVSTTDDNGEMLEKDEKIKTENDIEEEIPNTSNKRINWLGWVLGFSIIALMIYSIIWMGGSAERKIKEILANNGYGNDVNIVTTYELGSNIDGLIGNNKLVLVKNPNNSQYAFCAINEKDEIFTDMTFGYKPLSIIILKVFSSGEQMNIENFNIAIEYIKKYGYNCFTVQEYAEEYIREITGDGGIIPCETARMEIKDNISYILPDIHSLPEFDVIFEDGNANPMYYAGLSSEMKYRWSHIFPESTYKVWEASVDTQQKNIMKALYGQPYELQKVWAVVDKNFNKVGTYNSLEAFKEIAKEKSKITAKDSEKKAENNIEKNNKQTPSKQTIIYKADSNKIDKVKEMFITRLKNMGYTDCRVNISGSNKIEVILPYQNNIKEIANLLIGSESLKFTDHNNNVLLTAEDLDNVCAEHDKDDNSYHLILTFTQHGREKFKSATANISNFSAPNNVINIVLDDNIISAPVVTQEVDSDYCIISGDFSEESANTIANQIEYALLKPSIEILEIR